MGAEEITQQHYDVVAAAIVRDDTVLLCHHHPDREWYPNVWDVPREHINPGEPAIDALVRELREELGIEVTRPVPSVSFGVRRSLTSTSRSGPWRAGTATSSTLHPMNTTRSGGS